MNVKNAFLYCDLSELFFMEQSPGYVAQVELVYKLNKSIYGLKHGPCVWFHKFFKVLSLACFK